MPNDYGLQRLAQLIKQADPSLSDYDDATLEAAWREKYGDKMPQEVSGRPLDSVPATMDAAPGMLQKLQQALANPQNMPTMKGVAGGVVGAMLGGPIGGIVGAGLGGARGDLDRQLFDDSTLMKDSYDPMQTAKTGGEQAIWQALGEAIGYPIKRLGEAAYVSGAGLNRAGFSRNFPTAAQEGLKGGKFGMPILTSGGAQRVYDRVAPIPQQMLESAEAAGVKGPTAVDIARSGGKPVLSEIGTGQPGSFGGAALPKTERKVAINQMSDFIREHSQVTPATKAQTQLVTVTSPTGETFQIPQTIPGSPAKIKPTEIPLSQLNIKKQGLQARAADAMKATNADNLPGLSGRVQRGLAIGAQKEGEARVAAAGVGDLAAANRKVQGVMGVNQALNPSFRTVDELVQMGVEPSIAQTVTSNPTSALRLMMDGGAMVGGGLFGGPVGAILTPIAAHVATAPITRRVVGAGMYEAGRALPLAVQTGRAAGEATMDEHDILQKVIAGLKF